MALSSRRLRCSGGLIASCLALGLGGCATLGDGSFGDMPVTEPRRIAAEERAYQRYVADMLEAGRFRTDRIAADAPYDQETLARNFELVVFEPEPSLAWYYTGRAENRLASKWVEPIRYALRGDGVAPKDRADFAVVAARLSRLTGLPITEVAPAEATMTIWILSADERNALDRTSADDSPYKHSIVKAWITSLELPCIALFRTEGDRGGPIQYATIYIKAELAEPLRQGCILEETTQSLGLMFDHDIVRPSIFNDDQEFIALTAHDEALIMTLYDRRIPAGATRRFAAEAARRIIAERWRIFRAQ